MFKTQINRLLIAVVIFNACAIVGCHRGYYRRQADAEAKRLIRQKSVDPRWNTATGEINIDPQSRMFDPFSSDHPPIPPDDASSHQLMHCVDDKPGYPHWNANGDTNFVENPEWQSYLPVNEKGQVVLTLDGAYQLALIHSPELQEARETLYLSALDVSLDRFGFDSQLFAGFNSFFTTQGRLRNGNGSSSSVWSSGFGANGGGINLNRLGITGTNFAVGLANTVLFNFAGNDTQSATSLIDFSIIQPLLRGAGRDRIMESLTQSERTLLANVRQLERFRRGFYLQIAVGRNIADRLNRAGNFLGFPGTFNTNASGYLGLLQAQQNIRNQEFNVRQLEAVLSLFQEFFLRERLDAVQLKLFESNVYDQQRTLLEQRIRYQASLDLFKRDIGLPPHLDVVIDDTYLDQFKFISDEINEQLILTGALRENTGSVLNEIDDLFRELNDVGDIASGDFVWPADLAQKISELAPFLKNADEALKRIISDDREQLEADFQQLDDKREGRLSYLNTLKEAVESGAIESPIDTKLFETESLPLSEELRVLFSDPVSPESILNRAAAAEQKLANVTQQIDQFEQTQDTLSKTELYNYILKEFQEQIPGLLSEINNIVLELSLIQARTRSNSIDIIDVDITSTDAVDIARCMRRDWMNARATLVDSWRNIEFVADQLEAQVDLVFTGDIGNTGDNPFKLRYETGQLRGGFRFDAPIVRLSERNQYRAALISYQQTRRAFYEYEDSVSRNLRDITRNIARNKVLFELDRRRVQVAIEQVEINRYELEKPVGPGQTGGGRLGATTAQNLANAIIRLNSVQDSFLQTWVQYEVLRRNLDFDMGTMQLDQNFVWIDPGKIDASIGQRAAAEMGIALDCQFCRGVAAPGAMEFELISTPVPSVVEPQPGELPFEDQVPTEADRIMTPIVPQINPPETGMGLMHFNPWEKTSFNARSSEPEEEELLAKAVAASPRSATSEVVDAQKSAPIAQSTQLRPIRPSGRTSAPNAQPARARSKTHSDQARVTDHRGTPRGIVQSTNQTSPALVPLKPAKTTPAPAQTAAVRTVAFSDSVGVDAPRKRTLGKPSPGTDPSENEVAFEWQGNPSSLGGVLNRFRIDDPK